MDFAAFRRAVFFLLWSSPLIPLKMNPPTFFIPETIFPKMLPPLKTAVIPLMSPPRNLFCLLRVMFVYAVLHILCQHLSGMGFTILGEIVQCSLYFQQRKFFLELVLGFGAFSFGSVVHFVRMFRVVNVHGQRSWGCIEELPISIRNFLGLGVVQECLNEGSWLCLCTAVLKRLVLQ